MSNPEELSISELRRRRQQTGHQPEAASDRASAPATRVIDVGARPQAIPAQPDAVQSLRTLGRYWKALQRRWSWVALLAVVLGLAGLATGYLTGHSTVSVMLVQRDTSTVFDQAAPGDTFEPQQFSAATMIQLIESPEQARRVATLAKPSVSEAELLSSVAVRRIPNSELVTLQLAGNNPRDLVNLANLYATQAVKLTRDVQLADLMRLSGFLKQKIREIDGELGKVRSQMGDFQAHEHTVDPEAQTKALINQLGEVMARLEKARLEAQLLQLQTVASPHRVSKQQEELLARIKAKRDQLSDLLTHFTEAHPRVIALRAQIAELERQLAGGDTNFAVGGAPAAVNLQRYETQTRQAVLSNEIKEQETLRDSLQKRITSLSETGLHYQLLKARQGALLQTRRLLAERQSAAQLYQEHAAGYYRILEDATPADVSSRSRWIAAALGSGIGILAGLVFGIAGVCLVEARDDRIRTADDLRRVTDLPVLASLGDLNSMSEAQKDQWAFRTWTLINGKLDRTPDRGLVCGFVSERSGEGKSTWIDLLAAAASRRGLRVLKIAARPSSAKPVGDEGSQTREGSAFETSSPDSGRKQTLKQEVASDTISNALLRPAEVAVQLSRPQATSVEVGLPDWVWNMERRQQWQAALERWKAVDHVVILVELPPASLPESMLLAENVPQLIWLAASGIAHGRESRLLLETLKHAHCQIVGAVINKVPNGLHHL